MSMVSALTLLRSGALTNSLRALSVTLSAGQAQTAVNIPKKPPSGWARFFAANFESRRKVNPNLRAADAMKELSNEWKTMPENRKERFNLAWQKDVVAYRNKMEKIPQEQIDNVKRESAIKKATKEKTKAQSELKSLLKSLEKPQRPKSIYNFYVEDYFKLNSPNLEPTTANKMSAMTKVAEEWNKLSDEKKVPYAKKAELALAQYKKDMESWTKKMNKMGKLEEIMEAEQKFSIASANAKAKAKE